jgi:GNAT superfamily N-acetyltransferase
VVLTIRLGSEPRSTPDELARITLAIDRWNRDTSGVHDYHHVAIFRRDDEGKIRGPRHRGVWGGWLHVVGLWVDEELGRELVKAAEAEARALGARHAFLETRSFHAPGLSRKLGYVPFGEIEGYPPGHSQVFLRKDLWRAATTGVSRLVGTDDIEPRSRMPSGSCRLAGIGGSCSERDHLRPRTADAHRAGAREHAIQSSNQPASGRRPGAPDHPV